MAYLIDGTTELPENGDTGWGTTLNAAINAIDGRFTWTGGQAVANKAAASGITGTTLAANVVNSSLTSVGTLSGLTVSGTATVGGLSTSGSSFNLVNATATTVNFAGAATTISIGAATGTTTVNNSLTVTGDLVVNGTTTTVNSTTISVDDKNIELGSTGSPSNTSADGGGITLRGTTDKTLNWVNSTGAWTSSEDFNLLTGKVYEIAGTTVLSATALGTGVTSSSLTSVGTLTDLTVSGTTTLSGLSTAATSFNLVNTTATTVNFAGAATTISIGAAAGTTTVNNSLTVAGTTILGPTSISSSGLTSYTLALTDQGKIIEMTSSSATTVTVPPESSINFPTGSQIVIVRNGSGTVEIAPGVGVTIRSDASKSFISTQYSAATLVKRGSNEWYLVGNLSAS